ncbi:MAG TPA: EAL domain-containing protein [Steroidobacteraceae bacterium]|nr:EAL domain-containing protein [Steroidobacteraceae bacterium]
MQQVRTLAAGTILDDEDTIEAQALSTSLDPYGQLVKMLMPRANCIAIYDRGGTPLWLSDGCDGVDLAHLMAEALTEARDEIASQQVDPEERDGFARSWGGDTAYVFILRDGATLLGALGVSIQDGSGGARPFSLVQGLLRPALQVLGRELLSQHTISTSRDEILPARDADLELLLDASVPADAGSDDLDQLVRSCVTHLQCSTGALFIPDKKITILHTDGALSAAERELLEKTQRNLFAWVQVQRRTLMLNRAPPSSPMGSLQYKILACPVRQSGQSVVGLLMLLKRLDCADYDTRQVRVVEMMTRHIAYVLQNAYDPSTGLLTRPALEQRALAVLGAGNDAAEHCIAYADIDRLHVINENHGMHVGDAAIVRIAEAIRTRLPANVFAARISGDRFALFFADGGLDESRTFLVDLCQAISEGGFNHESAPVALSASFGLAAVRNTKFPLSHALAAAEAACKAAKDRGRGRVELYQEADRSIVRRYEDVAIIGTLREAIANDRFRMDAQPIVELGGAPLQPGSARRFELLLRMIDASGEIVAPDKFLTAAERYQLATDIDRWVVQYSLEILASAAPRLESMGAHFAINISGQSLGDEQFPAYLEQKLREYGLPPQLLSFEITETAAVANIVRAETLIRRLQDLGHTIALDDFGRGLSSLTYLKSLPVSHLKIDGGLIRDLAGSMRSRAMVTAIVQLAQAMKLETTAECVESESILGAVGQLGLTFGQGFAIGRPRSLEIVLQELLRSGAAPSSGSTRRSRIGL